MVGSVVAYLVSDAVASAVTDWAITATFDGAFMFNTASAIAFVSGASGIVAGSYVMQEQK